jgi:hypothetical protein
VHHHDENKDDSRAPSGVSGRALSDPLLRVGHIDTSLREAGEDELAQGGKSRTVDRDGGRTSVLGEVRLLPRNLAGHGSCRPRCWAVTSRILYDLQLVP